MVIYGQKAHMKKTTTQEEQPANLNEMFERAIDDMAKSQRDSWFSMCASALFIATIWKGEALAQMSGIPSGVILLIGCAPSAFSTIQTWRENKRRKAQIWAEVARREQKEKEKTPLPAPPSHPLPATAYPSTGHILKLTGWILVRALWSTEFLLYFLVLGTVSMGQQLALMSGIPTPVIYAIGFVPALLHTFGLLWAKRQRQAKRNAI
jgi:hypothetical protein